MKLLKSYYPFHLTSLLIIGIIIENHLNLCRTNISNITYCMLLVILICFLTKKNYKFTFSISCSVLAIFIGIITCFIKNDRNHQTYFKNKLTKNCVKKLRITKVYKNTQLYNRYKAKVIETNGKKTSGSILVHIKKDTIQPSLIIGQQFITRKNLTEIASPKNPYNFNYKEYLSKNNIFEQIYLDKTDIVLLSTNKNTIHRIAYLCKQYLQNKTKELHLSPITEEITNALLLGDRKLLKKETQSDFSNAGVIHILAISGLHVGILLIIFSKLLIGLNYIKHGKTIKTTLIIIFLWTYALITGLSASVVRAVTMFSFIHLGTAFKRKVPIEFSIISSMLVLLLFNPYFLFDLGFKMSYLAVFGIVWLSPFLKKIYNGKNNIIKYIWNLSCISITAQILILPLSIYHFHKFPALFLIANIVSIPVLGIIIGLGLLSIFLNVINLRINAIIYLYDNTVQLLYKWIKYISNFDYFIFENIHLDTNQMYFWYAISISFILFINFKRPIYFIFLLCNILIIQILHLKHKTSYNTQKELIVFHIYKKSLITILNKNNLSTNNKSTTPHVIKDYARVKKIKNYVKTQLPNYFKFKEQWFQIINSNEIQLKELVKNPIIILTNTPKINLDRILKKVKPLKVVADGSNYSNNVTLWKKTCDRHHIPFHSTYEKGYFKF